MATVSHNLGDDSLDGDGDSYLSQVSLPSTKYSVIIGMNYRGEITEETPRNYEDTSVNNCVLRSETETSVDKMRWTPLSKILAT